MGKVTLTFGDIENEKKTNFTAIKVLFFQKVQILKQYLRKNFLVKKNYKYFIGCLHNDHKFKQLHIILPKTSADAKSYDEQTKWMYFFIEDDDLLERYNTIWDKISADIKKRI